MIPWAELGRAQVPGTGAELLLMRRGQEYSLRVSGSGTELMNSRQHGSEDALAHYACEPLRGRVPLDVLIGGLGMGFTLAAALGVLPADAQVLVAELVPEVLLWNRGELGACAGHPLQDPRVQVQLADVADVIAARPGAFDAVLLDVDNGPEGLTARANDRLYTLAGLRAARRALRPGGVLAVWSASGDEPFTRRLTQAGFAVEVRPARARAGKGGRHVIWLGTV